MRSRFFNELTTGDIDSYLSRGGDLAILPLGSLEMHGPHLPVGTDSLIAKASSLRLAERVDGLVLPEIHYTWAGATDGFTGTVSTEPEPSQKTVETIAAKIFKMGFRRLVLMNAHSPNNHAFYLTARRLYETHRPVLLVDIFKPISEEAQRIAPNETSMLLAALGILGIAGLYSEQEMLRDEPVPLLPETFQRLSRAGTVGYHYQDARQHVAPSSDTSSKQALEFIGMQVESLAALADDLGRYIDLVKGLENQGTWR
jgi:creatinine amidohydrolase